jgi:hypothetical protein
MTKIDVPPRRAREMSTGAKSAMPMHRPTRNAPCPTALRFMPALTVTAAEVDAMLEILRRVLVARRDGRGEPVRGQ